MSKYLVTYFSATGTTARVAEKLADAIGADLFEIRPAIPYEEADLNWMDENSRTSKEMKDRAFRPAIESGDARIEDYDVIFIGFPIWWYVAPTIINTFLESYNFSEKKVILFATSGGSQFGETLESLKNSVSSSTDMILGSVINRDYDYEVFANWVNILTL